VGVILEFERGPADGSTMRVDDELPPSTWTFIYPTQQTIEELLRQEAGEPGPSSGLEAVYELQGQSPRGNWTYLYMGDIDA
jgi:hypothetical protein